MRDGVDSLAVFADDLRTRGIGITSDQVRDMAVAFSLVDAADQGQVHAALRSLAIADPDQRSIFDEAFASFFGSSHSPAEPNDQPERLAAVTALTPLIEQPDQPGHLDVSKQEGASAIENVARRDFSDLDDEQLAIARRLVQTMIWQPSDVVTRRWDRATSGSRPDMRATLRRTSRQDGDLIPIEYEQRRRRQRPLIVIADVSGSMERYAEVFLVFAHAAQRRLHHVEAFTFSVALTRITPDLERRDVKAALARVGTSVTDWSGGTKIGEALAEWNRLWSRRLTRGGPVALILSDGWDCGDPEILSREMARLRRTVHSVIWLNPLAARPDYQPATRGMKAALPHIDHLLPAASVTDLRGVVRLLDTLSRRGQSHYR